MVLRVARLDGSLLTRSTVDLSVLEAPKGRRKRHCDYPIYQRIPSKAYFALIHGLRVQELKLAENPDWKYIGCLQYDSKVRLRYFSRASPSDLTIRHRVDEEMKLLYLALALRPSFFAFEVMLVTGIRHFVQCQ